MISSMFSSVTRTKLAVCLLVTVSVVFFAMWADFNMPGSEEGQGARWWSILPSLLAISLAMLTQRIILSLLVSVIVGSLLASNFTFGLGYFYNAVSDSTNLQILAFVVLLLTTISIIFAGGGIQRLLRKMTKNVESPRSAQFLTYILGLVIFIDDYANTMLVGSTMRPLTDRFKVSRAKLAFIVDSTSAPIAGLAILSTWVGYEVGLFDQVSQSLSLGMDGYNIFLEVIGYRFYCILALVFVAVNVLSRREFGPMLQSESHSIRADVMPQNQIEPNEAELRDGPVWTAILPIAVIFLSLIVGLYIDSGVVVEAWSLDVVRQILSESDSPKVLAYAGFLGFFAAVISVFSVRLPVVDFTNSVRSGLWISATPIAILVLAWSLKGSCDELNTSSFMVNALHGRVNEILFPMVVFVLAGVTAFSTGTSWGTMAILIPTIIPVAHDLDQSTFGLMTMLSFAAILDGAIFGDHCSPISDTTIMSSTASQCNHMEHVRTQMPYSISIAAIACLFGYTLTALGLSLWISYGLSISLIVALIFCVGRVPDSKYL